jgi:hypothetical protein
MRNPFEQSVEKKPIKSSWTRTLLLCCLCAATSSLQLGYNIGSFNSASKLIKEFIGDHAFFFSYYKIKKTGLNHDEAFIKGKPII